MDFSRQVWHIVEPTTPFVAGWHLDAIAEHLEACTRGEIRRLLITMPPRCMKSLLVSVMWPAWVWIDDPSSRWLYSSYAQHLAIRDSLKCRDVLQSAWYQSRWGDRFGLKVDQNQKLRYDTDKSGFRLATSVGGVGTGEGGRYIVSDDPHNVIDSESELERDGVIRWWDQSMSTRGNDPKTVCHVVVMQRIHERDLVGHLLETGGYEHLNLPMEYEPGRSQVTSIGWRDPRREDGELLWPERFGSVEVTELKRRLGAQGTAGQLQQRPAPPGGSLYRSAFFQYFRVERLADKDFETKEVAAATARRRRPVEDYLREVFILNGRDGRTRRIFAWQCWWFQTVDTAMKTGRKNDYTACGTFAVTPDWDVLIYDVWRDKLAVPDQYPAIRRQRQRWPQVEFQAVEDKASGTGLIQQSQRDGIPFKVLKANQSKEQRAVPILAYYEAGSVFHRLGAPWLTDLEGELISFPAGAHDDMEDVVAHAGQVVLERASKEPRIRTLDIEAEREKRRKATEEAKAKGA